MTATNYLDADEFTALFRQRKKNQQQIFIQMAQLAAGVSRKFWFRTVEDRDEAQSEALVFAMERIDKFKPHVGNDAFSYYTSVIRHFMLRYVRDAEKESAHTRCFSQIGMRPPAGRFTHSADEMFGDAKPYSQAI